MQQIIISSKDAVVIKNSKWEVNKEIADSSSRFKEGEKMQSVQISDWKNIYKISEETDLLDHLPFGVIWKIKIVFEIPEYD